MLSCIQLFETPWTVACQAPLSTGFTRQKSWSGLPFPPPGDLPNPGIKLQSPTLQSDSLPPELPRKPLWAYKGTNPIHEGSILMTSYNPNHLLKAPLPDTITLEGSTVSLYESVGGVNLSLSNQRECSMDLCWNHRKDTFSHPPENATLV